uniref:Xyloside xylosyltransferase 1-like n=1 Tax=Hirondellea gigas TaxID=1518452 RepID=A0A2P2I9L9_9CRUS
MGVLRYIFAYKKLVIIIFLLLMSTLLVVKMLEIVSFPITKLTPKRAAQHSNMSSTGDAAQAVASVGNSGNTAVAAGTIEIALIFRHGSEKETLQHNFQECIQSVLQYTSSPLRIHVVTDAASYAVATKLVQNIFKANDWHDKPLKMLHVPTEGVELLSEGAGSAMVGVLQEFFTSRRNSYYRDPLFFFSLFLHNILPTLTQVILMDVDVRVVDDIADLHSHFSKFQPHHVIGMSQELAPTYRHVLSAYRINHPTTTLGSPPDEGGFPGYNSGVMLVNIPALNSSTIIASYLERKLLEERCNYYSFRGNLGDQDLYTLIAFDHPYLFYTLPCTWNRQLCQWWRNRGYSLVFDHYFNCPGKVSLYHGNCKSTIPELPGPVSANKVLQ